MPSDEQGDEKDDGDRSYESGGEHEPPGPEPVAGPAALPCRGHRGCPVTGFVS